MSTVLSLPSVLVVEDDKDIQSLLSLALSQAGFNVTLVKTVAEALASTAEASPDIAVVDWMLPQGSGVQLVQQWRKRPEGIHFPILFLTARQEERDKLLAFEHGADDYLTKPFSVKELVARLNALLRRTQSRQQHTHQHSLEDIHQVGALRLDTSSHRVTLGSDIINMNPTEFKLLLFFITHQERVYTRAQLLDQVWGYHSALEERTIDVHIRRLRKAFETHQAENLIETVRGVGYRFNPHVLDICLPH